MHDSLMMWGSCVRKVQANIKRKAVIIWTNWLFTTQRVCEQEAFFSSALPLCGYFPFPGKHWRGCFCDDVALGPSHAPSHTLCFACVHEDLFFFPLITLTASPSIYTLRYFKPTPTPMWCSTIKSAGLSPWNVTEGRYHRANVRYITHI